MKRISDRKVAEAILFCLARHEQGSFCCSYFYDYDSDFLDAVAKHAGVPMTTKATSWTRRVARVARRLQNAGILSGRVSSCHAEYIGEPKTLKSYSFFDPGYAFRIAPDLYPNYNPMGRPEVEVEFLLERF